MRSALTTAVAVALLGFATSVLAGPLEPGSTLAPLTLNDQHDEPGTIDATTRMILFTRDMDASKVAKETFAEEGDEALLERAGVAYVADISGMPRLISRFMAVPAMRRRPYRMLLDRDGEATADFPTEEGHVTLIEIDGLTVQGIEYAGSVWELRRGLRAEAAEGPHAAEADASDTAETASDAASDAVEDTADAASDAVEDTADAASDTVEDTADAASNAVEDTADAARDAATPAAAEAGE